MTTSDLAPADWRKRYQDRAELRLAIHEALRDVDRYVPGPALDVVIDAATAVLDARVEGIIRVLFEIQPTPTKETP